MKGRLVIALALGTFVAAAQAGAHHSIAATYRENQTVTIEGELSRFQFRNPHSIVHLVVRSGDRREVSYAVEWAAAGQLEGEGVTSQTLRVGDHVVITGNPARDARDRRMRMVTLRRPKDNFSYDGR